MQKEKIKHHRLLLSIKLLATLDLFFCVNRSKKLNVMNRLIKIKSNTKIKLYFLFKPTDCGTLSLCINKLTDEGAASRCVCEAGL